MGQSLSVASKEAKLSNDADKSEQLLIMSKLIDSKLNEYQHELNESFFNLDARANPVLMINKVLRWERHAGFSISGEFNDSVDQEIDRVLGPINDDKEKPILNGFKGVVKSALMAFLGQAGGGESTHEEYFIHILHNSLMRVDLKFFRWDFTSSGMSRTHKSCLGYLACLSNVDTSQLTSDDFVYILSESVRNDNEYTSQYIDAMRKAYDQVRAGKSTRLPAAPHIEIGY
ncbi:hypothetical protein EDB80DRAFT_897189 [Ilyonectria destructans]|nr:hypothetical protein EDB80DRAFT_897189 [Ilyonectria destructans]